MFRSVLLLAVLLLTGAVVSGSVLDTLFPNAVTPSDPFTQNLILVTSWLQGSLGKLILLIALLVCGIHCAGMLGAHSSAPEKMLSSGGSHGSTASGNNISGKSPNLSTTSPAGGSSVTISAPIRSGSNSAGTHMKVARCPSCGQMAKVKASESQASRDFACPSCGKQTGIHEAIHN